MLEWLFDVAPHLNTYNLRLFTRARPAAPF
jgi:hypothetical protein